MGRGSTRRAWVFVAGEERGELGPRTRLARPPRRPYTFYGLPVWCDAGGLELNPSAVCRSNEAVSARGPTGVPARAPSAARVPAHPLTASEYLGPAECSRPPSLSPPLSSSHHVPFGLVTRSSLVPVVTSCFCRASQFSTGRRAPP